MKEIWKDIEGYEGLYQVSNMGRVKSYDRVVKQKNNSTAVKKNRIIKLCCDGRYLFIGLTDKNGKRRKHKVHRLVAFAFIPNPHNYPEVNHKDEDKTNNCVDNLEWCDRSYNVNYGTRNKRMANKNLNGKCSKLVYQFDLQGFFIKEWPSSKEIERQLGYNSSAIYGCCNNRPHFKTAYGYIWKYKKQVS